MLRMKHLKYVKQDCTLRPEASQSDLKVYLMCETPRASG